MRVSGLLLVDKPQGFTSHDVVAKARKALGTKKIGHAGTLDPLATGLLLLGVNSGTKLLTFLVGADKTYHATIRLGAATVSDDSESETTSVANEALLAAITDEQIGSEISKLTGKISQRPSSVSAIKVQGKRAYDLVREGKEVELAKREVTIHRFELAQRPVRLEGFIDLTVEVECSSGTYIRALARDLGEALGVGGHLTSLRRTRVGGYRVEDAVAVDQLEESALIGLAQAAAAIFPTILLSQDQQRDLIHGKRIKNPTEAKALLAGLNQESQLVAVLEPVGQDLKSVVVFQGELND